MVKLHREGSAFAACAVGLFIFASIVVPKKFLNLYNLPFKKKSLYWLIQSISWDVRLSVVSLSTQSMTGTKRAGDYCKKKIVGGVWQTSILWIVGELAGGGSVAVVVCVGDR